MSHKQFSKRSIESIIWRMMCKNNLFKQRNYFFSADLKKQKKKISSPIDSQLNDNRNC